MSATYLSLRKRRFSFNEGGYYFTLFIELKPSISFRIFFLGKSFQYGERWV